MFELHMSIYSNVSCIKGIVQNAKWHNVQTNIISFYRTLPHTPSMLPSNATTIVTKEVGHTLLRFYAFFFHFLWGF